MLYWTHSKHGYPHRRVIWLYTAWLVPCTNGYGVMLKIWLTIRRFVCMSGQVVVRLVSMNIILLTSYYLFHGPVKDNSYHTTAVIYVNFHCIFWIPLNVTPIYALSLWCKWYDSAINSSQASWSTQIFPLRACRCTLVDILHCMYSKVSEGCSHIIWA